jgi:predicted negative regulator of RcsB-dependent stress response
VETYRGEDEQVQALKDWWKENGRAVIAGLVIGIAVIAGYRYWQTYQKTQSRQASLLYAEVIAKATASQPEQAFNAGRKIIDNYGRTPYATLTAFTLARLAVDKSDYETARVQLRWALDNTRDDGFRHVARLRLARVLAAQAKPQQALELLQGQAAPGFDSLYQETRGDILAQQDKANAAAEQYRLALGDHELDPEHRRVLEMKLNDLAGATARDGAQS